MKRYALFACAFGAALLAWGGSAFAQSQGSDAGALVAAVAPGGPAEKAGIARGDIILSVGDKDVSSLREVEQALASGKSGDSVAVKVSHGDATRIVQVMLEERNGRPYLGLFLVPPFAAGRDGRGGAYADLAPYAAFITEVTPDSPASKAGLEAHDVVVGVDGTTLDATHSLGDLIAQHKPGDTVTLSVASQGGRPRDIKATLAQSPAKSDVAYLGIRYGTLPGPDDRQPPRMRDRGPDAPRRPGGVQG
jgi:S1-C subfamily serine protease